MNEAMIRQVDYFGCKYALEPKVFPLKGVVLTSLYFIISSVIVIGIYQKFFNIRSRPVSSLKKLYFFGTICLISFLLSLPLNVPNFDQCVPIIILLSFDVFVKTNFFFLRMFRHS